MNVKFPYTITMPTDQEADTINDKMDDFNGKQVSFTGNVEVFKNYVIKDNNEIIAGIRSVFYLGSCLVINVLFVDEKYRLKGLGSALLQRVVNKIHF